MTLLSILCPSLFKESKSPSMTATKPGTSSGVHVLNWFWGAAGRIARAVDNNQVTQSKESSVSEAIARVCGYGLPKGARKEADSSTAHPQVLRQTEFNFRASNLQESAMNGTDGAKTFRVILLQEGLGNLRDAFYYSKDALLSAVPVFTGAKIYADHPSMIDEESRPERSVRDILGHFENIAVEEAEDGRANLMGDVHLVPGQSYDWARGLMLHAIENEKKFPDRPFIGLSINANGDADPTSIDDVISGAPESVRPKLVEAKEEGIDSVKVVRVIKSAVSCDLVTEAGAGGAILSIIETKRSTKNGQKRKAR